MEQWEHLLVQVGRRGTGHQYLVQPPQPNLQSDLRKIGSENTVALLNELGRSGWHLAAVDSATDSYWMRRRA